VALFICMVPGRCAKRLQIGHNSSLVHTQLSRIVLNVLLAGFEHGELLATRLARLGLTNILFAIPPSNTGVGRPAFGALREGDVANAGDPVTWFGFGHHRWALGHSLAAYTR